jgi:hypothetical protein
VEHIESKIFGIVSEIALPFGHSGMLASWPVSPPIVYQGSLHDL